MYKQQKKFVKKDDKTLLYQVFDTTKYMFIEDAEIGINQFGYVERINLQGKKDYIPENLHLFDSLERMVIDLRNLKQFPDISKIKSLKILKINISGIDEPINVPKSYENIEHLYIKTATKLGHYSCPKSNIIFQKGIKIKELTLRLGGKTDIIPSQTLKNLHYLKFLDLGFNKIKFVDLSILPDSMEILDLSQNDLKNINLEKTPKSLKKIILDENPLENPSQIREDGKRLGIRITIDDIDNGVKVKVYEHYRWIEL
ncbi:MAG: hypothetical protein EAZ06_00450 [Cytophagales bacterium]|nr:MAG: hypothetical protein EAZ06_00450 [Cytophagales bacterium]